MSSIPAHIALLIRSLDGGGMQRALLTLGGAFAGRGHRVDLLVGRAEGPMRDQVPPVVRLVPLEACAHLTARAWALAADPGGLAAMLPMLAGASPRILRHLPALARYLRAERPDALLAFGTQSNLAAVWARRLAGGRTRIVISERNTMSAVAGAARTRFRRAYPRVARRVYPEADAIVAVCNSVAEDLASVAALPRDRIATIYNPTVTPRLLAAMQAPLDHPWTTPNGPSVILGVGRLHWQKDFATLLRAFARVRAEVPARLVILGEGAERARLEALTRDLNVAGDVALPGFVANPYAWMARASVLVVSSLLEGIANVLCEAMACGCPVVSTDCPGGPREVLDEGAYGALVPVGDDRALAQAVLSVLRDPPDPDRLRARAAMFSLGTAVDRYLRVLLAAPETGPGARTASPAPGPSRSRLPQGTVC